MKCDISHRLRQKPRQKAYKSIEIGKLQQKASSQQFSNMKINIESSNEVP